MELKSKCAALDTNVIVRLIVQDIPTLYRKAVQLVLSGLDFYVDPSAIAETVYVLTKDGRSRDEISHSIQTLLNNSMFIYERDFYRGVFRTYTTHPSLSFDDCVLAARAEQRQCIPLYTFDRKLARQSTVAELVS